VPGDGSKLVGSSLPATLGSSPLPSTASRRHCPRRPGQRLRRAACPCC
jgi:hypothetical protein